MSVAKMLGNSLSQQQQHCHVQILPVKSASYELLGARPVFVVT